MAVAASLLLLAAQLLVLYVIRDSYRRVKGAVAGWRGIAFLVAVALAAALSGYYRGHF